MNDSSSTNRTQNGMPSDDEMDSLLRDFFRLEVPTELNQPLRHSPMRAETVTAWTSASENLVGSSRSRATRFVAVAASVAAMVLALLVAISGNHAPQSTGRNIVNKDTKPPVTPPSADKPMLVSPGGDTRSSTKVIGPDGVTLEETDTIELHPQR